MDIRIVLVWVALVCCVITLGHMLKNAAIVGTGALMAIFTCAFAC